ncbi:hypothetical protein F2Q69_00050165 [Brassica cretica]|uniref:Uncharacterized protein n=1 Tax=Brassica cretica TaxID=69181 RepID=A0A8S9PDY6_BRACR|nr:hypothetical protein F2Q69_00050165 [Brassica cretica]
MHYSSLLAQPPLEKLPLHESRVDRPVADSGESVAVVTGCLPLNLFCLFPFSVLPPSSALCPTDIPSVVVSLPWPASLLGDLARSAFSVGRLCFGGGAPVIVDSFGVCSGSQCLSLVRVNVVLGCCSLPSSSFPVTASVASISAVRVLVLWFLPCGVSSFYRAGSGGSGGREEQRWLFAVIGAWGFDRFWFVGFRRFGAAPLSSAASSEFSLVSFLSAGGRASW